MKKIYNSPSARVITIKKLQLLSASANGNRVYETAADGNKSVLSRRFSVWDNEDDEE